MDKVEEIRKEVEKIGTTYSGSFESLEASLVEKEAQVNRLVEEITTFFMTCSGQVACVVPKEDAQITERFH